MLLIGKKGCLSFSQYSIDKWRSIVELLFYTNICAFKFAISNFDPNCIRYLFKNCLFCIYISNFYNLIRIHILCVFFKVGPIPFVLIYNSSMYSIIQCRSKFTKLTINFFLIGFNVYSALSHARFKWNSL